MTTAICQETPLASGFSVVLQPLYSYLRGNNKAKLQIDMAKPAITLVRPDKEFSSTGTNYTVLFYLPDLSEVSTIVLLAACKLICYGALLPLQALTLPCSTARRQLFNLISLSGVHALSFVDSAFTLQEAVGLR